MRIVTFASSSSGNCSLVSDGAANILIDAGISMRRTVTALRELGLEPRDLCGVLITHEHSDHISGLKMLVKHYGLRIFAPAPLCRALGRINPEIRDYLNYIPEEEYFLMGGMNVKCFRTPHDAEYSVGYRIEGSSVLGYATDTGCITDELISGLEGADIALIEANHDLRMLRDGPYPYYLKRRIISDHGHLSNDDCALLAQHLEKTGTRYIIVGHLSRENNRPQIALDTVGSALSGTAQLFAAPMDTRLSVSAGEEDAKH